MSYEKGVSIGRTQDLIESGYNLEDIAYKISTIFNEMTFTHGFVHADPHPGNIYIRKNKSDSKSEIILFDHGVYQFLDKETRLSLTLLWRGIVE
jgi:aarF domain-containing kinase